jgi:hypothetical protein
MSALIRASLVALLVSLGWIQSTAADTTAPADVKASSQGGFGRIQFEWREKAQAKTVFNDGILVISFDRAFDVDTDAIQRSLDLYVALVRQDPDKKSLRFALKGPVVLKTTDYGTRFAFDIVPPSFRGEPPPIPAPVAEAKEGPVTVPIRVAEREHTTTLLFDWPVKVD